MFLLLTPSTKHVKRKASFSRSFVCLPPTDDTTYCKNRTSHNSQSASACSTAKLVVGVLSLFLVCGCHFPPHIDKPKRLKCDSKVAFYGGQSVLIDFPMSTSRSVQQERTIHAGMQAAHRTVSGCSRFSSIFFAC